MSNSNTAFDDLFEFIKDDNFKMIKTKLNEKAYKAMGLAGAEGIAVGIVVTVIGIAAGVISIISGARLLKEKKGILF